MSTQAVPILHQTQTLPFTQLFPAGHGEGQTFGMHVATPPDKMQSPSQHEAAPIPPPQSAPSARQISSRQKQKGNPGGALQPH